MCEYEFHWETECGMDAERINAADLRTATAELKRRYPDDIGADGFVTLPNGDERAIDW